MPGFGVFDVDVHTGELRRHGVRLHVQEQPLQVLQALIERPGRVVTREELQRRLWPDGVHVDYERGLTKAVQKLREAIGDSAESPRFIETVPRHGYRFIAPVSPDAAPAEALSASARAGRARLLVAVAGLTLAVTVALGALHVAFLPSGTDEHSPAVFAPRGAAGAARGTPSTEAYEAYLRGRYHFARRTPDALRKAIEEYRRAAWLDPGFAHAHAGLVHAFGPLVTLGYAPLLDSLPEIQAAAERALALDPDLAEVHTAVGLVRSLEWNWAAEEEAYRRALVIDPSYATAYQWYAFLVDSLGRFDESLRLRRRAIELDPLNVSGRAFHGAALFRAGAPAAAIEQYELALELDPSFGPARAGLGAVLFSTGRTQDAIAELERSREPGGLGYALAVSGQTERAREVLADMHRSSATGYVSPLAFAAVHAGLGEPDQAFRWLERAYQERTPWLMRLNVDWRFTPLRDDPRFAHLARRVGLPPPRTITPPH